MFLLLFLTKQDNAAPGSEGKPPFTAPGQEAQGRAFSGRELGRNVAFLREMPFSHPLILSREGD